YGDIVRVSLGGQCMTYLFGPDAVKLFFSASDDQIGFRQAIPSPSSQCCCCDINMTCNPGRPATEHFTGRVFGLPSHLFFPHHTALLQGLRAQLTPAKLPSHGHALLSSMKLESDRADLMCSIKDILFQAAVESVFGSAFLQWHGTAQLQKAFFAFEKGFELAASPVPHFFQPSFCKARQTLLQAFRVSWAAGHFGDTVVGQLLQEVPELHGIAPHVLLALLWASLANTIPATFWALAFLLLPDNQEHKQQILLALQSTRFPDTHTSVPDAQAQQEKSHNGRFSAAVGDSEAVAAGLAAAAPGFDAATHPNVPPASEAATSETAAPALDMQTAAPDGRGNDSLVAGACDRSSLLAGCVAEAVRVRAPGVAVRMATCDLAMPSASGQSVHISKGDMLAVSPYESHHDPRFFQPWPARFDPNRGGLQCLGSSLHEVPGISGIAGLVFGGGRYRCPGRFFAEMEVALTVAFFLTHFKMQLVSCQDSHGQPGSAQAIDHTKQHKPMGSAFPESGDPHGLLPQAETRRQVGIRWPKAPCEIIFKRLQ
ncbi:MAG: cytochrome P450, partial [Trebouxia sp. A1-2]